MLDQTGMLMPSNVKFRTFTYIYILWHLIIGPPRLLIWYCLFQAKIKFMTRTMPMNYTDLGKIIGQQRHTIWER